MTPTPLVLDTDIGTDVDDALALAFVLASPELDLVGVTIVDGDVDVRARIAARLLGMAGRPDIPVIRGASTPNGAGRGPTWFGHESRGLLELDWDGPEATILDATAAEWLVETSRTQPFHLAAVGPFTNVANAVLLDPTFVERVPKLTVMGGMAHPESYDDQWRQFFAETGLPPNHMDHNTASDVDAALTVARAGFEMTWVTAELTFCTTLDRDAIDQFRSTGTVFGDRLANMTEIWASEFFHHIPNFPETARPFPERAVAALHDPLAIASIFGGEWLLLRDHDLRFTHEGERFGMYETDGPEAEATHRCSTAVDRHAFNTFFRDRLMAWMHTMRLPTMPTGTPIHEQLQTEDNDEEHT